MRDLAKVEPAGKDAHPVEKAPLLLADFQALLVRAGVELSWPSLEPL